jgi:arylsulfatase A-like enzyme
MMVIDTLRADHTSLGGYPRPTTPRLAELVRSRATAFLTAEAPATSTIPSVKAMLTGQAPSRWGLDQAGEPPPAEAWTLQKAFSAAGYRTAGFTSNTMVSGGGFEAGFGDFVPLGGLRFFRSTFLLDDLLAGRDNWRSLRLADRFRIHKVSGATLVGRAGRWLEAWSREPEEKPPFFLYVHIFDPHWPYYDHGGDLLSPELRRLEPKLSHVDLLQLPDGDPRNAVLRHTPQLRELVGRYDEEIRFADARLGSLVDDLERFGFGGSTLLIVVGDHGEELFDHNGYSHGHDVFEEQSHVPWVIRWPAAPAFAGFPPAVEAPVSPLDLLPTLSELLALPAPPEPVEGRSLLPVLRGEAAARPVLTEAHPLGGCRFGYREGSTKVRLDVTYQASPTETARVYAFDLASDPREMEPLDPAGPEVAAVVERARQAAQERWLRWPDRLRLAGQPPPEEKPDAQPGVSGEERDRALEELRALGYVD